MVPVAPENNKGALSKVLVVNWVNWYSNDSLHFSIMLNEAFEVAEFRLCSHVTFSQYESMFDAQLNLKTFPKYFGLLKTLF